MNVQESEDTLLTGLRNRDASAFETLFQTYSDRIYRLSLGLLTNESDAEAIVQETFIRVIEKIDQFEERSSIGTWIYRIAYNLSQDELRKRQRQISIERFDLDDYDSLCPKILTDWGNLPEQTYSNEELHALLTDSISKLPEALKTVFLLREIEGVSTIECGQILDLKPGTIKVRLHRARLTLREILASHFVEKEH